MVATAGAALRGRRNMTQAQLQKVRLAHLELCRVCRRWVLQREDSRPISPLLPVHAHSIPELVVME